MSATDSWSTVCSQAATAKVNGIALAARGGFEPLSDFALAALADAGPGKYAIHLPLPEKLTVAAAAGGAIVAGISVAQLLRAKPGAPAVRETGSETAPAEARPD